MAKIIYEPIGTIHTPFKTQEGIPIQPAGGKDVEGIAEVDPRYEEALSDLDGFSHVYLVYHLHKSEGFKLKVVPFLDTVERGLFATRAPRRPNPIGISVVNLVRIEGNKVYFTGVDMLDGTPLLDVKPAVRQFDRRENLKIGWLEGKVEEAQTKKSDDRFKA